MTWLRYEHLDGGSTLSAGGVRQKECCSLYQVSSSAGDSVCSDANDSIVVVVVVVLVVGGRGSVVVVVYW
jgi:hypothetical protein